MTTKIQVFDGDSVEKINIWLEKNEVKVINISRREANRYFKNSDKVLFRYEETTILYTE